jgi:hypothetical protein
VRRIGRKSEQRFDLPVAWRLDSHLLGKLLYPLTWFHPDSSVVCFS